MVIMKTKTEKIVDVLNYIFLGIVTIISALPILHIVAVTFSSAAGVAEGGFIIWPNDFSLDGPTYILSSDSMMQSMGVSFFRTVLGTVINMFLTILFAYSLSFKHLRFRKQIMIFLVFTMVYYPGMIPAYLNVRELSLYDTIWALVLPGALSTYNVILLKNFFQSISPSLRESAMIDGCSEPRILAQIMVPLSKPILATLVLFYAVGHWNAYMDGIMYISKMELTPFQVQLRNIVMLSSLDANTQANTVSSIVISPTLLKYSAIFVATLPIVLVYPFLQKYFVKGVMLGSVKE